MMKQNMIEGVMSAPVMRRTIVRTPRLAFHIAHSLPPRLLLAAVLAVAVAESAKAASQKWTGGSTVDGNWSSVLNWNGAVPGSTAVTNNTDVATFNAAISNSWGNAVTNPVVVDANRNISGISFTTSVGSYFIGSTGGNALKLTSAGTISLLVGATGVNLTETINAPLSLQGDYTISNARVDAGSSLVFGGTINNAAASTLTISGAGTGTGNLISGAINDGTGVQSLTITTTAGKWTLSGVNNFTGAFSQTGGGGTVSLTGTLNGPASVTINNATAVFTESAAGVIAGASTTFKLTSGTATLAGANTYGGGTTVSAGTLKLDTGGSITGMVTVAGGTLEIANTSDAIANTTKLQITGSGKVQLDSGVNETVGTLLINSVPQASGTWGATGSGASNTNDTFFTGPGVLTVARGTAGVFFVNPGATGVEDGSDWSNAYKTLTNALASATGTFWVAQGTYTSTVANGVEAGSNTLCGGFTTSMSSLSQRNWTNYPTILDGANTYRAFSKAVAGTFTLDGFTVQNCTNSAAGGAITVSAGSLQILNCLYTNNATSVSGNSGGGAICLSSAGANNVFSNCTFKANRASAKYGGAIYVASACTNTFQSCTFVTNVVTSNGNAYGSAIFLGSGGRLTLSSCSFSNNAVVCTSGSGGGAVYNGGASLDFSNVVFYGNSANGNGGAIAQPTTSSSNVFRSCRFEANQATTNGGALSFGLVVTNTFIGCVFVANTSTLAGGAIKEDTAGCLEQFTSCTFSNNTSGSGGGGAVYSLGTLDLSGGNNVFYGNTSGTGVGGAILNNAAVTNNVFKNCAFVANGTTANSGGAIYLQNASTNQLINCTFFTNSAAGSAKNGGAVCSPNAGTLLNVTNCIFWGNTATGSGTNIQNGGTLNIGYSDINTNAGWITGGTMTRGAGITNVDPFFASTTAPYDVHLQSQGGRYSNGAWFVDSQTSPCIDAGVPFGSDPVLGDYSNEPIPNGGRVNLGAYGNTAQASKSYIPIISILGTNGAAIANNAPADGPLGTDFGHITYQSPAAHTFIITNSGTKTLVLTGNPAIVFAGSNPLDFYTNGTAAATNIPPGGSTTFQVQFDPKVANSLRTATITITNSDNANTPYIFAVSGIGDQAGTPGIQVLGTNETVIALGEAATVAKGSDFGTVLPTSFSDHTFTVTNNGTAELDLTGAVAVAISGDVTDFFTNGTAVATNIASGGITTFQVRFAPTAMGVRTALVSIANNAAGLDPYTFALHGTGDSGAEMDVLGTNGVNIAVGEATSAAKGTDWGTLTLGGGTVDHTFTVTNRGVYNLTLSSVALSGSTQFAVQTDVTTPVGPGSAVPFTIRFNPSGAGLCTALVSIANNDLNENPYTFALTSGVDVPPVGGGVKYVNAAASLAPEDGSTWQHAYRTLANAVASAAGTFWVAGTFTAPTAADITTNTLYGGFQGTETALSQRDWTLHPTILDGSGTYPVLSKTVAGLATLDGFTVRNASSTGNGAGLNCTAGSLQLFNCLFTNNTSAGYGGAIYHAGAGANNVFSNCTFTANRTSAKYAGAIYVASGRLTLSSCSFSNNAVVSVSAGGGGAVYNGGTSLDFSNVVFYGNSANGSGGAIAQPTTSSSNVFRSCRFEANQATTNGGALSFGLVVTNTFIGCVFVANTSTLAGGAIKEDTAGCLEQFTSCTFSNNTSGSTGGGAVYSLGTLDLSGGNNVFYGNTSGAGAGGAIFNNATAGANNVFKNCAFVANGTTAHRGGAISLETASTNQLINCTFFANSAAGSAKQGGAVYGAAGTLLNVTNCIFWGNTATGSGTNIQNGGTLNLAYSDIKTNAGFVSGNTLTPGAGITNVDPLFASTTAPYDVHLQSQGGRYSNGAWVLDSQTSPCIDAGVPFGSDPVLGDYSNEPMPNGAHVNLGAYGNTAQASKSLLTLTVVSDHLGAWPGTVVTNSGATLTQYVTNSPVVLSGNTTQYVCMAGVVASNEVTSSGATNVTLTLTNDATLTWQWATNYWMTAATNGNGSVNGAANWYAAGSNVAVTATPASGWSFSSWSGTIAEDGLAGNAITAAMIRARSITANFLRAARVTASDRAKTYGETVSFAGTEFTASGFVNGDTVTGVTLTSAGADGAAAASVYAIAPSAAAGPGVGNYVIAYSNGTLTVNKAATSITGVSPDQVATEGGIVALAGRVAVTNSPANVTNGSLVVVTLIGASSYANNTFVSGPSGEFTSLFGLAGLPPATYTIKYEYGGDGNFTGSLNADTRLTIVTPGTIYKFR